MLLLGVSLTSRTGLLRLDEFDLVCADDLVRSGVSTRSEDRLESRDVSVLLRGLAEVLDCSRR